MEKITINPKILKGLQEFLADKKDSSREALKNIYSGSNGKIYSTNGISALRISKEDLAGNIEVNSVYRIISTEKINKNIAEMVIEKQEIQYPEIEKLFSEIKIDEENVISIHLEEPIDITRSILNLFEATKNAFNYALLEKFRVIDNFWKAYPQGKPEEHKPMYMKSTFGEGLILPFLYEGRSYGI